MPNQIEQLLAKKNEICLRRDKLADEYTRLVQLLVENENNADVYDMYVKEIEALEPETNQTKEEMREVNRALHAAQNASPILK